ncbi:MAG: GerMN domain-containing protein [Treponema sp.]|nr:GerMN domain-containing protein [Treponema sp.]
MIKDFLKACAAFFMDKRKRSLFLLGILIVFALTEFLVLGLARRTFVFYAISNGKTIVEDRMLRRSGSQEANITRYVREAILGPVTPDTLPLFYKDTRLLSLLYRDGVVYINVSEEAALPPADGGEVFKNLGTLYTGIRRNFSYVNDVRFFIAGNEAYPGEFR